MTIKFYMMHIDRNKKALTIKTVRASSKKKQIFEKQYGLLAMHIAHTISSCCVFQPNRKSFGVCCTEPAQVKILVLDVLISNWFIV